MKAFRFVPVLLLALSGVLVTAGVAGAAAPSHRPPGHRHNHVYNCTGGNIPAGRYDSIIITGVCYMPAGTIKIHRDLKVAPGALLDATTPGDPSSSNALLPATVLVGGNVFVGNGAVLILGCSPFIGCQSAFTYDRIGGNLTGLGALGVIVHGVSIRGNLTLIGGGIGITGPTACTTIPNPWAEDPSLANGEGPGVPIPVYSDAEDNTIGGSLRVIGLTSCWLGSLRNQIGRNATFVANTMADPDANEINNNLIGGSFSCFGNSPAVQWGDTGAAPNIVGGRARGECGFKVVDPNPSVSGGTPEHISVSFWSLGRYKGTHAQTSGSSTVLGTTTSNDTLVQSSATDTLGGSGLTGSVEEMSFDTVRSDGAASFYAEDSCTCSFQGQSGTVTIIAQGFSTKNGFTRGTFMIVSGGAGGGGLSTLAGFGTFSSAGEPAGTLRLHEFLKIS